MISNLLEDDDMGDILSCNVYWEEVAQRDSCGSGMPPSQILRQELIDVVGRMGSKILWVLADYAKEQKINKEKNE